ncbi:hypothetical protein PoB_007242800 [Plakobranchus ocellatus]|uniref:Uncharacterized protein n=1 Tax=Plakobranchus ocellatus TaxID=259542 RepID=A0AAV4DPE0_9GAST|nr:hypothetical protein PoB_007242800 [Plakobranchus ocellatus]
MISSFQAPLQAGAPVAGQNSRRAVKESPTLTLRPPLKAHLDPSLATISSMPGPMYHANEVIRAVLVQASDTVVYRVEMGRTGDLEPGTLRRKQ